MNFFILITSILFVLPDRSRAGFRCPPSESIHPCTCNLDFSLVSCINVGSLDIVRAALTDRFHEPLPTLKITDVSSLPQHALGDIRVKRLRLTDSDITDIHDEAFDGQDFLGLLWMSNDHLTDIPTEALKRLPGLRTLNLNDNYITQIGVNSFNVKSRIRFLFLNNNSLSTIEMGAFPRSLHSLNLANNHLSTLNGSLLHLDSLETLYAGDNELQSLKGELRGLTRLISLDLSGNDLASIDGAFDDLISLTDLNLANNRLQDLEDLLPLKNLRLLKVADNQITSLGGNTFSSLNAINNLDLSGNRIRNVSQAIKPLVNLKDLRMSNMSLNFLCNDSLEGMQGLVSLDLSLNGLTNIDFVTGHSFPQMRFLNVQGNHLQNFTHGFKNLKSLYKLDISFNRFVNVKRQHFIHNSLLRNFNIEGNKWDCSDSQLWYDFAYLSSHEVELIGLPNCSNGKEVLWKNGTLTPEPMQKDTKKRPERELWPSQPV